ncbi:hypothetical protein [Mycobacteroides abscessus]|uniref:hypothetical protein n=1 Tax=Mycobacteroides abscessus TaxID=36809 RepID=UPI0009260ABB|nr:hypothetical protein [Mycobacteroides abscessus]SHP53631.1 Uncharacterised protein [Mycobacteroides abscessus subsp. abscessus]
MEESLPGTHEPPGPADTVYPIHKLAVLAFAKGVAELADEVAAGVGIHEQDAVRTIDSIIESAQKLRRLAIISAYENGQLSKRAWDGPPVEEDPEYGPIIAAWRMNVERPWQRRTDSHISWNLPAGLRDPAKTAKELDAWVLKHREDAAKSSVSKHLTGHTRESEIASLDRHRGFLQSHSDSTQIEWQAHNNRDYRINTVAEYVAATEFLDYYDIPDEDDPNHHVYLFWTRILDATVSRQPTLRYSIVRAECLRANDQMVVIGSEESGVANVLAALQNIFAQSIAEVIGRLDLTVRVLNTSATVQFKRKVQAEAERQANLAARAAAEKKKQPFDDDMGWPAD